MPIFRSQLSIPPIAGIAPVAAIALLALSLPARAAVPMGCQPVLEAIRKQIVTPTHLYATETAAFPSRRSSQSEMIYAGDAIYVKLHGSWTRSPLVQGEMLKQQLENERNAKAISCRLLRAEAVKGEAAAVYLERSETDEATVETTAWISKSRGLPLRLETDLDVGGKTGKSHRSVRFEYGKVQAPAGVK